MPVCTTCAFPTDYLYTTYRTKSNIRLGVCGRCGNFLDPLIEHPPLILLLDLILLKPRVYLHLLFNRGAKPFDADTKVNPPGDIERESALWDDLVRLAVVTVVAGLITRLTSSAETDSLNIGSVLLTSIRVTAELLAQHLATLGLALLALWARGWYPIKMTPMSVEGSAVDGRQVNFTPIIIPLTLLYSTILPLLLQLVLQIWSTPGNHLIDHVGQTHTSLMNASLASMPRLISDLLSKETHLGLVQFEQEVRESWLTVDKIWAGTRLLGGMSAGFGLRVILPTRPWETTAIVLGGWIAAGLVGKWLS